TPNEPVDSLSMGDEYLNTILATKSDEFIKSCVENLVPNPSESDGETMYDVPAGFITFSNVLFDADYDSDSSDDQSLPDEDDSDSYMEEIDLFCTPDYPMSPGIEDKNVAENISPTKEPQVLIVLPTHPTLQLNLKFQPSSESLFTYAVWIFLLFLVYSVVPCYLLSLRNEDIIFDPGICKSTFSKPDISYRCGTVKKFNTHCSHLNTCPMLFHRQNNPPLDVLLFHFYPP
nr:hypothetical protein [Tanacetum cinerariifolium]